MSLPVLDQQLAMVQAQAGLSMTQSPVLQQGMPQQPGLHGPPPQQLSMMANHPSGGASSNGNSTPNAAPNAGPQQQQRQQTTPGSSIPNPPLPPQNLPGSPQKGAAPVWSGPIQWSFIEPSTRNKKDLAFIVDAVPMRANATVEL